MESLIFNVLERTPVERTWNTKLGCFVRSCNYPDVSANRLLTFDKFLRRAMCFVFMCGIMCMAHGVALYVYTANVISIHQIYVRPFLVDQMGRVTKCQPPRVT